MRRPELEVGAALYWGAARGWEASPRLGERVVVLAVEPYQRSNQAVGHRRVASGQGVHVLRAAGGKDVVRLAELRGDYDEVAAQVRENHRAAVARDAYGAPAAERAVAEFTAVRDRASALGFQVTPGHHPRYVAVSTRVLSSLLDVAAQHGWRAPQD